MKKISSAMAWLLVFVVVIFIATFLVRTTETTTSINFNQFQQNWIDNKIKSFKVSPDKMLVTGKLKDNTAYETVVPTERLNQFIGNYPKDGVVEETYVPPITIPMWVQWIPSILIIVMLVAFWFMFMQQSQGGGGNRNVMNFGKSKAKMATPDKKKVTFEDVAGADEEKAELAEIVDFLKHPERYRAMGARIPKGVLLVGPPGTGKTLLAKAISGEAGVPFFSISGSDFVEMFVGVGASRVRDLFEQAKKSAPCIIFIDEIDAVGRQRGAGLGGGHDEREQTLNQLLVEMDGFGINENVIMIAATNRPDILDPALLRPGRFDRQIMVVAPDVRGREEILKVHSKNKIISDDVKLDILAKRTPGFTGADLENLMNEAALLAVRYNKTNIGMEELEEATMKVVAGPEKKSRKILEQDRKITAYHEAGHAVVMRLLPNCDPVHEISIVQRGMAAGYTMHLPENDSSHMSKSKILDEMVGLLGGRVAEEVMLGDICTGASNDIQRATNLAKKMVMEFGMSEVLGPINFASDHEEVFLGRDFGKARNFSEEVGAKIDSEIRRFIEESHAKARILITANKEKVRAVAEALLENEKLNREGFERLFDNA